MSDKTDESLPRPPEPPDAVTPTAERTYLNPLTGERETWEVKWARVQRESVEQRGSADPWKGFVASRY